MLFDGVVFIVELEPSKVKFFTRQGSISSEFEKRLKQIRDYVMYYREHRELFNKFIEEGLLRKIPSINEIQGILIISSDLSLKEFCFQAYLLIEALTVVVYIYRYSHCTV